ncbi:hypothetical protein GCM10011487_31660 [Steroidobacter agaridevorans]|uniref:YCII-related domain-containing protein n=1 Tax=Steroidobacter agaridevorans TaxID=2695856 RepID=A0A829YEY2_9GAMM|nr:YciI family protein [Steroidobacter agaridevorans]GFE81166.1 hypothetical protein GCM10011487_31660 [Steroidobacter agaridevorans]GFE88949.1 hypothetical protein GCM10011488_39030 [Steroidobacter agaridevorans]
MKFLCLAFGDQAGWDSLTDDEKAEVLAQDDVIRSRGATMSAVRPQVTSVRNWDKKLEISKQPHATSLTLAGFSIIEAEDIDEVVKMVANTPCARGKGVIEIRPFWNANASAA